MILDDLPPELRPTVQVIDDWFTNRRLGLVFEAQGGQGASCSCAASTSSSDLDDEPGRPADAPQPAALRRERPLRADGRGRRADAVRALMVP